MNPSFSRDGVCIAHFLPGYKVNYIRQKLTTHILESLQANISYDLSCFHLWYRNCETYYANAISAKNRHFETEFWNDIDLIPSLLRYLQILLPSHMLSVLDDGLGTSAFRLIRPGFNDGYPPSRKSWAPGDKHLISITIPIIGYSRYESQAFLLGSHLKEYPSELPTDQKFMSNERRLVNYQNYSFNYFATRPGDIIIFHWNTIHSEQIIGKDQTRLALEVRFHDLSTVLND